jgi:hypothetical protein
MPGSHVPNVPDDVEVIVLTPQEQAILDRALDRLETLEGYVAQIHEKREDVLDEVIEPEAEE